LQFRSADVLEKVTGARPVGIRTPSWDFSPNTLAITKEMGLLYDSSLMADVDCYELELNGEPTGVVELPVEWIRDDAVYFNMVRFANLRPYTPPGGVRHLQREFDAATASASSAHHASAHQRLPLADLDPGQLICHALERGGLVRDAC
jgi:peptidoglycan/xylan/chitin deacetylase (PgdA/CDA1 family)